MLYLEYCLGLFLDFAMSQQSPVMSAASTPPSQDGHRSYSTCKRRMSTFMTNILSVQGVERLNVTLVIDVLHVRGGILIR